MTELAPEPTEAEAAQQPSRRGFIAVTGGGAAAIAAASLLGSAEAADAAIDTEGRLRVGNGPFVVYVDNVQNGKMIVFAGNNATRIRDKRLVRRIVRKAGK